MDERLDYQRQLEERERRMQEDDERLKQVRDYWKQWASQFNERKEHEQIQPK